MKCKTLFLIKNSFCFLAYFKLFNGKPFENVIQNDFNDCDTFQLQTSQYYMYKQLMLKLNHFVI